MNIKKILLLIASLFISYETHAQNNLDVYGNFGYTYLSGFSFSKTSKVMNSFSGLNIGISGLYNFDTVSSVSPVLGLSLNSVFTKNSNSVNNENIKGSFNYFTTSALGGVKLNYFNNLPIYVLLNLGYSPSNSISFTGDIPNSYTSRALNENSFKVTNHYFYGATLMSTYNLVENFSLGGSLNYNRHSMDLEMQTPPESTTERSGFNEYSVNLIAMFTF
ncbi:opacity family porin [Pigmentibacter sp. JX0631]|uniref:opacity family porin n=1 Tax=Pigmentibacter sp. JX0631 TaxID=2976982 RepID=UPI00246989A2|nr:opacity family porin [Pigmentibacter sp. JX0631]WGL59855.1 opacity family porin [Pigmentibacter sp. JX0631]